MSLLNRVHDAIKHEFLEHPYSFFTEHDFHFKIASMFSTFLEEDETSFAETLDGHTVSLVHHEYPTPFRCHMKGTEFKKFSEEEYQDRKRRQPSFRARRGHFDIVIFNPEYVATNKLEIIPGKKYKTLLESFTKKQPPAIDLAIEIVYFPSFDHKPHFGIMKRRVNSTIQDYEKLKELMDFRYPDDTPFCQGATMMFFSNTQEKEKLITLLKSVSVVDNVSLFTFIL